MKHRVLAVISLMIIVSGNAAGSVIDARYKRKIEGIEIGWRKIILPKDLYYHARPDLHDLRIIGVTAKNDTIEAPYLLEYKQETLEDTRAESRIINEARKGGDHYFTIEVPSGKVVNKIWLQFGQRNFDWLVSLEGSHDQKEWFEVLNNYRIVSIKNALAEYTFSTLNFKNSNYRYYRIRVESDVKPTLESANIHHIGVIEGIRELYDIVNMQVRQMDKNTVVDLKLNAHFPASNLQLSIAADYDYYRNITIEYLADSFETEKGWRYQYRTLTSGTVTSLEDNVFKFDRSLLKRLRVIINNQDNEPLQIDECQIWGYQHTLITRIAQAADYYLVYGDRSATKPNYDITYFADRIPDKAPVSKLLGEENVEMQIEEEGQDFFIPKGLLWGVLIFIVIALGYFAGRMLKSS